MLPKYLVALTTLLSFPALAGVSFAVKQARVESLASLEMASNLNIDAYKRELQYEKLNLSNQARVRREFNLLTERLKSQILMAYESAIKEHGDAEVARTEIESMISNDLRLASPEIRGPLKQMASKFLEDLKTGVASTDIAVVDKDVEEYLLNGVRDRRAFINYMNEGQSTADNSIVFNPSILKKMPVEKRDYSSKNELVNALFSDQESARWVSTTNMTVRSIEQKRQEKKISLQVKINFLGAAVLEVGPYINFSRIFSTNANVMAEGLDPVIKEDGSFDFWKRTKNGEIAHLNGKKTKRFISFYCDADLSFETEYSGSGGFKVGVDGPGISATGGVDLTFTKKFSSSVNLSSRRVVVPEYIDNEVVTLKTLADICHNEFLGGKFNNQMTVSDSLEVMMKNVVAGLEFTHPRTKCVTDESCFRWYNKNLAIARIKTFPRCVEDRKEKSRSCELRGLVGQNCTVFKNGKKISNGSFEFVCDKGLKCVQTREAGFFKDGNLYQSAKGQCMPRNKRTYESPIDARSYRPIRFTK